MTTNDDTSNRKQKNNLAKHFLRVKYTCTLYSGMEGSIYEKKDKGAEVPHVFLKTGTLYIKQITKDNQM